MSAEPERTSFATVWGALLRHPGWVRFPSMPAQSQKRSSPENVFGVEGNVSMLLLDLLPHPSPLPALDSLCLTWPPPISCQLLESRWSGGG